MTMADDLAATVHRIKPRAEADALLDDAALRARLGEVDERWSSRRASTFAARASANASAARALVVVFAGPAKTSKTLAAEIVAGRVGADLLRVDAAAVVSRYIGDTEKNLERIFADAERIGAVLLLDEADALFGKRSDVDDAHDRYAAIESSSLLARIGRFDGLVIVATNAAHDIDPVAPGASVVRVDFPCPATR